MDNQDGLVEPESRAQSSYARLEFAVTRLLRETPDPDLALERLLEGLCTHLGAQVGEIWLLDRDADLLRRRSCWYQPGLDAPEFEALSLGVSGVGIPRDYGLPGRLRAEGDVLWMPDLMGEPDIIRKDAAARGGLRSALVFAASDEGRLTGAAVLLYHACEEPDEALKATLRTVGHKIGEFVRAEQALQRSQAYFRAIVENQCDIVALIGLDGTIHYENEAVADVLGYDRRERIGKNAFDFIHPADVGTALDAFRAAIDEPGSLQRLQVRARHKDGSWRLLESTGRLMVDVTGTRVAVVNSREVISRPRSARAADAARRDGPALTEGQKRILQMVAEGMTNRKIADELSISPHTVKDNLQGAMRKLNARSRAQAVLAAARAGVI